MQDNLLMDQGIAKLDFTITVKGGVVSMKGAANALGLSGIIQTILETLEKAELSMVGVTAIEAKSYTASGIMMYLEESLGLDPKKMFT